MSVYGPGDLLSDMDRADEIEALAKKMHRDSWEGRTWGPWPWEGKRTNRKYWRNQARIALTASRQKDQPHD